MNSIIVSFDQKQAVRVRDGMKLKAVPRPGPSAGIGRCRGCEVNQDPSGGCYVRWGLREDGLPSTDLPRFCMAADRKDGRNVTWRTYDL